LKPYYAAAILLAIPIYLPRLMRSFWLDEAGTFFMVRNGFWAAIEACSNWPGQSILYGALTSLFCLEGGPLREPLLRLPGLIGLGLLLYFTARLATRALGATAGLCAFVLMLFHPQSFDLYIQARAYGLAAAAVAASYWMIYEWVETRRRVFAAGWAVATVLIFYLHYLYVVSLLAQGVYLAWVFVAEKRSERWRDLAWATAAVPVLLAPLLSHMLLLVRQSYSLSYVSMPDFFDLVRALAPFPLLMGVIGGGLVLQMILVAKGAGRSQWSLPATGFLVLAGGWWLLGTLVLFCISRSSTLQVFIDRYLGSSAPADALLLSAIGVCVFERRSAIGWAFLAVLLTTGSPLNWRPSWDPGPLESRTMTDIVSAISPEQPPPLIFQSSLVESNVLDWRRGPSGSYAFNELVAYPVPNRLFPLPTRLEADTEYHVQGILDGELKDAPMIVYVRMGEIPAWIYAQLAMRGYRVERMRPNAYSIAIFRK